MQTYSHEESPASWSDQIQKRHVIGYNLGVADEHYAELTQTEQPGETVALIGDETRRFAETCLRVVADLEAALLPPCVLLRRQERANDH